MTDQERPQWREALDAANAVKKRNAALKAEIRAASTKEGIGIAVAVLEAARDGDHSYMSMKLRDLVHSIRHVADVKWSIVRYAARCGDETLIGALPVSQIDAAIDALRRLPCR